MSQELPDYCPGPRLEAMFQTHLQTHTEANGTLQEIKAIIKGVYFLVKVLIGAGACAAAATSIIFLMRVLGA